MSSEQPSVSLWLQQLQSGDREAAEKLWQRYFARLVGLARTRLQGLPRRVADEEDVALSAFDSFCRGAEQGRFPRLDDRDNLWRLLVTITARKAYQLGLSHRRQKRGGEAVLDEAALAGPDDPGAGAAGLDQLLSREPTPEFAAQAAEDFERLLAALPLEELRAVARWKMEGYRNEEIAAKLGCAPRSVERRLHVIRAVWEEEGRS
jgi:DNA-directed RNA polymerase specialized sigma24 family protein